jgi:hypothetical protein
MREVGEQVRNLKTSAEYKNNLKKKFELFTSPTTIHTPA